MYNYSKFFEVEFKSELSCYTHLNINMSAGIEERNSYVTMVKPHSFIAILIFF